MSELSRRPDRLGSLDGLRGIAALAVFAWHSLRLFLPAAAYGSAPPFWLRRLPLGWAVNGQFAVLIFFALSGFVLSHMMSRAENPFAIVLQRVFRLFPVSLVGTIIAFFVLRSGAVYVHEPHYPSGLEPTFHSLLRQVFVTIWSIDSAANETLYDLPLWTIGLEFRCSILLLLFVSMFRDVHHFRTRLVAQAVIAYIGFLICGVFWFLFSAGWLLRDVHVRFGYRLRAIPGAVSSTIVVCCLFVPSLGPWPPGSAVLWFAPGIGAHPSSFFTLLSFMSAVGLIGGVLYVAPLRLFFGSRISQFLGRISFPLYAIHDPVIHSLGGWLNMHSHSVTISVSVVFAICVLASYAIAAGIDEPCNRASKRAISLLLREHTEA